MDSFVSSSEAVPGKAGAKAWMSILWLAVALGLAALAVRMAFGSAEIGQDQAWLLYAAERMLHGVQLYGPQLTETNPPLIIWMSAVAVGFAKLTGVSVPAAFYLLVAAVMVGSAAWCYRLLDGAGYSRTRRVLLAGCVFLAESRPVLEALGQREHLLVMLVLPFLVAFGVRRRVELARWEVVAVAAVAAVGVCLKPQQVILLAGFLGAVVWREWRSGKESLPPRLKPEYRGGLNDGAEAPSQQSEASPPQLEVLSHSRLNDGSEAPTQQSQSSQIAVRQLLRSRIVLAIAVVCAVCVAYGAAVMVFAPQYVRGEMQLLVETYWAFGTYSAARLVVLDHHFLIYVAMGAALWMYARRRGLQVSMPGYLLVASVAASVAFDLQHTGFMYQHIPQDLLAELAIFWLVVELVAEWLPLVDAEFVVPRWAMAVLAVAVSVIAGAGAALQRPLRTAGQVKEPKTLREFYASLPQGTAVMGLSTNPQAAFPYVEQYRLTLASRFVHLWMLPAVEQNEWYRAGGPRPRKVLPDAVVESVGALQREQVATDIAERKPMYVVVPRCVRAYDCEAVGEAGFSMVGWLSRDAGFAAAWSAYQPVRVVEAKEHGLVYDVYGRR